ncbi:hypothetical protein BI364_05895 [Acidihalobacter yilgarnensis]|uniref:Uncharacterized protein n=1 Tax=Acidihalobacter yilgarnensis TaxID=2819280 RepID=A0A1D8IM65_9GAMM|nr:hypothetical protein BI364_05895 [Acidihalobacter yilgarnensis]
MVWVVVDHELMPHEVEVDPVRGAAAFGEAEDFAVEAAGLGEVSDGHREVKRLQGHGGAPIVA